MSAQLGYAQAQARTQLRQRQLLNESLRAERDRLQSRRLVLQEALALGMKPRGTTPVLYVSAPAPEQNAISQDTNTAASAEQGTYGGTTADSGGQQPFDH